MADLGPIVLVRLPNRLRRVGAVGSALQKFVARAGNLLRIAKAQRVVPYLHRPSDGFRRHSDLLSLSAASSSDLIRRSA